jgi:hypothetical protein
MAFHDAAVGGSRLRAMVLRWTLVVEEMRAYFGLGRKRRSTAVKGHYSVFGTARGRMLELMLVGFEAEDSLNDVHDCRFRNTQRWERGLCGAWNAGKRVSHPLEESEKECMGARGVPLRSVVRANER